jgi:adenine-specific DNA-methyltransferase
MREVQAVTTAAGASAGEAHLLGLSRELRRATGTVYTPELLVEFVLDRALEGRPELLDGPLLDPACGSGAFLLALLRRIAARLVAQGHDLTSPAGHAALVDAAESRLRGLDVDEAAVDVARRSLREEVRRLSPGPLPRRFLQAQVRVGDFLVTPVAGEQGPPALIVGNPPYVPVDRLDSDLKARLRRDFATATGRLDLYTVFMEQAARAVALNGRWALITPDKYLTSRSAARLRQHLVDEGSVRSVARFDSHRVFSDAATVPCVTVWDRRPGERRHVDLLRCTADADGVVAVVSSARLESTRLCGSEWRFGSARQQALSARIAGDHPRLRDLCLRVSAGPATGYNPAFVLTPKQAARIEPELIHRTAGGRDVTANRVGDPGTRLLVPYRFSADGPPTLIDLADYPRAASWLARHKKALRQRHCVRVWGKAWWDLHDPVADPLHTLAKVLVPDLARTNRFAADTNNPVVPQHSLYYALPGDGADSRVIAALLNSPAVQYLVLTTAPIVKDGFRRYRRQFLLDLPVPQLSAAQTRQVLRLVAEQDDAGLAQAVGEAYRVEPGEIRAAARAAGLTV